MASSPILLVVDDEANFREIFQAKLSASGFTVETAENGQQAIDKAKVLKPSLVLMDVKMPDMEGPQAAEAIKADPMTANTKIVFLTSLGDPGFMQQDAEKDFAKQFGFEGYIKKTDDLDMIVEKVKSFLA